MRASASFGPLYPRVENPVDTVNSSLFDPRFKRLGVDTHFSKFPPPQPPPLVGGDPVELVEALDERLLQEPRRGVRVRLRSVLGLHHDPVDHPEVQAVNRIPWI